MPWTQKQDRLLFEARHPVGCNGEANPQRLWRGRMRWDRGTRNTTGTWKMCTHKIRPKFVQRSQKDIGIAKKELVMPTKMVFITYKTKAGADKALAYDGDQYGKNTLQALPRLIFPGWISFDASWHHATWRDIETTSLDPSFFPCETSKGETGQQQRWRQGQGQRKRWRYWLSVCFLCDFSRFRST